MQSSSIKYFMVLNFNSQLSNNRIFQACFVFERVNFLMKSYDEKKQKI